MNFCSNKTMACYTFSVDQLTILELNLKNLNIAMKKIVLHKKDKVLQLIFVVFK